MKQTWEERFDEEFKNFVEDKRGKITFPEVIRWDKSFIASELQKQKEEIVEMIKGMKPHHYAWFRRWGKMPDDCKDDPNKLEDFLSNCHKVGMDEMADDIIKKIGGK